jgi:hypothetical protein
VAVKTKAENIMPATAPQKKLVQSKSPEESVYTVPHDGHVTVLGLPATEIVELHVEH